MAGLPRGYRIPKVNPGHSPNKPTAEDDRHYRMPHPSAVSLAVTNSCSSDMSQEQISKIYSNIYSKRCGHCNDFHDSSVYCYRLKRLRMSSSESGSESSEDSRMRTLVSKSESSSEYSQSDAPEDLLENDGPDKTSQTMASFLKKHQRIDNKPVTLVLSKEMIRTYFKTVYVSMYSLMSTIS